MSLCSYVKIKKIMSKRSSLLRVGEQLVLKTKEQVYKNKIYVFMFLCQNLKA